VLDREQFLPHKVYVSDNTREGGVPRVLIAPQKYIQGQGVLDHLGRYLSIIPCERVAVLVFREGMELVGGRIIQSLQEARIQPNLLAFDGECSYEEVDRVYAALTSEAAPVDCLIAAGGGKCLDTGKCVAHRLSVPLIVCPTIASTDAPCSAMAVMYTKDGVLKGVEFFPRSPAIVVVDTAVIAAAPVRHLLAGMADALATWYEARTCFRNPRARSMVGARTTMAALGIADLCARIIYEYGPGAVAAARKGEVNEALERVVEANTLLSGVGFESGGLAAAHAVAQGFTVVPRVHETYLHGEMVAIGLLVHLILEDDLDEARKVARFLARLGLPVHLGQLSLDLHGDEKSLQEAMKAAVTTSPFVHNEPFEVTPEKLLAALSQADEVGKECLATMGDAAWHEARAD
jgi:glycerol dehydrogenase